MRFSPRPGPRLLIVQTQFSSLWLRPRVASGRPEPPPPNLEGGEAGRSAGRSPDTRDPAAALGAQGARPAAEVQLRCLSGFPRPRLGRSRGSAPRRGSLPSGSPLASGRLSARPAGEGEPGSTARVAREGGDVSVAGWGDREGGSDVVPQRPSHGGGGGSKGCGVSGSCGLSGPGRRSPGVPGERPSAGQREGRSRVRGRGVRAQGQGAGSAEGRPRQRLPPPKPLRRLRRAPLGGGVRAPSP